MKPDYKNWIPKGMIYSFMAAFLICAAVITVLTITPLPSVTFKGTISAPGAAPI